MESFASLVANIIRTKDRFSFSKKKFVIFFSKTILISSILYISDETSYEIRIYLFIFSKIL